ncbi:MAG TPA: SRPBCC family protein [Pseudonocardia sp.]|nr:SRPBCC family protein [Pseudonocardia sp.]
MTEVRRTIPASPEAVWAVLADAWNYPAWVVGASRARAVSADWPEVGSVLHHSVGVWPLVLDDRTTVTRCEKHRRLVLRGGAWPFGEADIDFALYPLPDGSCEVVLTEDAAKGPARLLPGAVRNLLIAPRNVEVLRRLGYLASRRATADPQD